MKRIIYMILIVCVLVPLPFSAVFADQQPANGTVKELDGQGRLKSILKYKNGHLLRKRVYHANGALILDVVYRQEAPIIIKTYYLNRQLKSVWTQESNEARFFYPTGQHKVTVPVREPSKLEQ
jgi:antitoxin component YwqK of YwqJK toxin-antitoxin module